MLSIYKIIATVAFLTMCVGVLLRNHRNPKLHAGLMGAAITMDLVVVLILEFTRQAVETAVTADLGWPQATHIISSTIATVLYFPVTVLGWKRLKGTAGPTASLAHHRLGLVAFAARAVGFVFMWTVKSP